MLNFARQDVADWAFGRLTRLVAEHRVDFLKWDMNRVFGESGWAGQEGGNDRLWTAYVRNLYGVLDRLRQAHPELRIETCSGGGGRVDLGILARTDQAWTSDNTDAVDRLGIQQGFSQVYPARVMSAWVTDVPNQLTRLSVPLRFRFHAAMAGLLGLGGDLTRWSEEELAEAAALVARYKEIRHLVQHGDQYRIGDPYGEGASAVQYVAADGGEAVVLVFRASPRHGSPRVPLRLRGLPSGARFRDTGTGAVHHATVLAEYGLDVALPSGDWASALIHLERVPDGAGAGRSAEKGRRSGGEGDTRGDALALRLLTDVEGLGDGHDDLETVLSHTAGVGVPGPRRLRVAVADDHLDGVAEDP